MTIVFKTLASEEMLDAIGWYERKQPGLGRDFQHEVDEALKRAAANPEHFAKTRNTARKIRLKRFWRYSVYFLVNEDVFSVIAVFHGARKPSELKRRLS